MQPVRLDKLIAIKSQSATRDALNQKGSTWSTITNGGTVAASIVPVRSSERQASAANQAEISHRVTIRYRSDVTADMRIYYGTRQLAINGIRDINERHEWLEITCLEGKHV